MKRWFIADRLFVYAPTKRAARALAGRYLAMPPEAWAGLLAKPAGRYEAQGNRIVGGPAVTPPEGRGA